MLHPKQKNVLSTLGFHMYLTNQRAEFMFTAVKMLWNLHMIRRHGELKTSRPCNLLRCALISIGDELGLTLKK